MKLHLATSRPNAFGGSNVHTLCRRSNASSRDGFNSTSVRAEVTCKFCIKLMPTEPLFRFDNYDDWVNSASRRFRMHGVSSANTHCLDEDGRLCEIGRDFQRARDEKTFPVRVFEGSALSAEQSKP